MVKNSVSGVDNVISATVKQVAGKRNLKQCFFPFGWWVHQPYWVFTVLKNYFDQTETDYKKFSPIEGETETQSNSWFYSIVNSRLYFCPYVCLSVYLSTSVQRLLLLNHLLDLDKSCPSCCLCLGAWLIMFTQEGRLRKKVHRNRRSKVTWHISGQGEEWFEPASLK